MISQGWLPGRCSSRGYTYNWAVIQTKPANPIGPTSQRTGSSSCSPTLDFNTQPNLPFGLNTQPKEER